MIASLPPEVEAARQGLVGVEFDGIQQGIPGFVPDQWQFTVRDPEFSDSQPTFYLPVGSSPSALISRYAITLRAFGRELTLTAQIALARINA